MRWPIVISMTLLVEAPGVLQTTIPCLDASLISILSTPTPALPIKRNPPSSLVDAAISSAGSFVALRIITASNPASDPVEISSGS